VLGGFTGTVVDVLLELTSLRRKNAICLSFMYSLSGIAITSASVSSSAGLVFQLLASLGSFLAAV
jgi:hypothetical protein